MSLKGSTPAIASLLLTTILFSSCGGGGSSQPGQAGCAPVTGNAWVPRASVRPAPSEISLSETVLSASGPVLGYSDPALESATVVFRIPMPDDLGQNGSLSLVAETGDLPPELKSQGVPLLVSLNDGRREWIPLQRAETVDAVSGQQEPVLACADPSLFTCGIFGCEVTESCVLGQPSAYADLSHWVQRQLNPFAPLSVNVFPTCNWNTTEQSCAFNTDFFQNGERLPSGPGVEYTARYLILADSSGNVPAGTRASLTLHAIRKKADTTPGSLDVNIVLVGSSNVQASRTPRGQANLDALVGYLERHYSQGSEKIRIGRIQVFEWGCEQGGDAFSSMDALKLGELFKKGSRLLPESDAGPASSLNLFLIGDLSDTAIEGTLLGVAGGIPGAMLNGTGASGVAIATFNRLDRYNPRCPENGPCPRNLHDEDFWTLGTTLSHETGHFLGLNHPSEGDGLEHDSLPDTPACSRTELVRGMRILTVKSCLREEACARSCQPAGGYDGKTRFCPDQLDCEFNHLMWWTLKNYNPESGEGDGNALSDQSFSILRYHPLIR